MTLRIATRKSALALWQAEHVRSLLAARGFDSELVPLSTEGDRILDRSLAEVGGKGLFVKELEAALLAGRAELAVHSAKDVPFALAEGLVLAAFPQREDPRDALVAPGARTFDRLPRGARVGTSSLRRAVSLLARRPDLAIVPVRGNVQTRLARATGDAVLRGGIELRPAAGDPQGPLDAVVLALAGLRRLGLADRATELLSVEVSLPAAGQGALALEVVRGSAAEAAVRALDHAPTARCVRAERALLARLQGGCTLPVAAYAVEEGTRQLWLRASLGGAPEGGPVRVVAAEGRGDAAEPEALGQRVAEQLLETGGAPLLAASHATSAGLPTPRRA